MGWGGGGDEEEQIRLVHNYHFVGESPMTWSCLQSVY